MRNMHILILLFLMVILPFNINVNFTDSHYLPNEQISIKQTVAEWTFMVYMDADNNLESAAIGDFLEMSSVGSTSEVNIVVLMDRHPSSVIEDGYSADYGDWTGTLLFEVTNGLEPYDYNAIEDFGERNMGDPQTLIDFINYTVQHYPANRYFLVLWDHGGGYTGCCWDETSGNDNLDASEIFYALQYVYENLGVYFDIIGFDACLMSMVDIAFAVSPFADYMVASQEYEPGDGWPYDDILSYLVSNYWESSLDIANKTAYYYALSYAYGSQGYDPSATQSVIDLTEFFYKVPDAVSYFAKVGLKNMEEYLPIFQYAGSISEQFYSGDRDLLNFTAIVRALADYYNYTELVEASDVLINALLDAIVASYHLSGHPYAYGISAVIYGYDPSSKYYYDIWFARVTMWDEFVQYINDNPYKAWLYDAWIENTTDVDSDGFYEMITIGWDVDVYGSQEVNVTFILWNETTKTVAEISYTTTNNESDVRFIRVPFPSKADWNIEIKIQVGSEEYVYDYVYNVTDDLFDIKGEPDVYEPALIVYCKENNSIISTNTITIEYEAYDNETYISGVYIKIDDGEWNNLDTSGIETITFSSDGSHVIYLKAIDANGNENMVVIKVTVDTTPPTISITSPEMGENVSTNFTLKWIASDNVGLAKIEIYIDGELYKVVDANTTQLVLSLTPGEHKIKLIAYDKAGHTSSTEITITVTSTPSEQENEGTEEQNEGTTNIGNYILIVVVLAILITATLLTIVLIKRK